MKKPSKGPFRVIVGVDATKRMGYEAFEGVVGFLRESNSGWVLHGSAYNRLWLPMEVESIPPGELDGVIVHDATASTIRRMRKAGVCWVSIFEDPHDPAVPAVISDNEAIGRLAGRHLLELQVKHFVYYGSDLAANSEARFRGFAGFLDRQGCAKPVHLKAGADDVSTMLSGRREQYLKTVGGDILALSQGGRVAVGVFAFSDHMGITLIDACRTVGLAVPEKVAVIAVATDELIGELSNPPLTTIRQDAARIGREGAAMLNVLLGGRALRRKLVLVPPLGIRKRASTDVFATDDAYVIKALQIMRERYRDPLSVPEILAVLKISRRLFEKRFRRALGRSPHEEIIRLRVRHAETLLAQTAESIPVVAMKAGFASQGRFRENFMKMTGLSPLKYRQRLRQKE